ncbi:MAG TPA: hypothetical protein EYG18_04165 [Micavibrio sp.]|nr:hypothetical protein [Pseudomonadota bacterium]MEC8665921.1 hypothetical protein [Pseudomonadota bacterium]HIF25943.1 hypothetical protein [Micavibrio sp.]HIL28445.1 hypothetical protein [Micavibrio sp.]
MRNPRFTFPTQTNIYGDTEALRNKLLSRSFQLAAEDRDGIRRAVKSNTPYELPLTATRPAAGWKNRLQDFFDAAWDLYLPGMPNITPEEVKDSKGYKAFYAAIYDMGYQINGVETETKKSKSKGAHTVASLDISLRAMPKAFPSA